MPKYQVVWWSQWSHWMEPSSEWFINHMIFYGMTKHSLYLRNKWSFGIDTLLELFIFLLILDHQIKHSYLLKNERYTPIEPCWKLFICPIIFITSMRAFGFGTECVIFLNRILVINVQLSCELSPDIQVLSSALKWVIYLNRILVRIIHLSIGFLSK